ncbi:hypothetical protein GOV14_05905 [Candidatus Pacearchaeota archaeon]|nr:hypothetical protein [Candidatus Pacearchaeota archaeon]
MITTEEKRKISRLMRKRQDPNPVNTQNLGLIVLENIINAQIDSENQKEYENIEYKPKKISQEYNLGSW